MNNNIILNERSTEIEKILPLYDSPVKALQFFVLGTIYNEEEIKPWFYCNYIQLEWIAEECIKFSLLQDYYVGYPFIDKQILIRDLIDENNIVDFFIRNINHGWYTHLSFDEYYLPEKWTYKKGHFLHDDMICGYNMEKKIFYIYGYCANSRLEVTIATFEEIKAAFSGVGKLENSICNTMQYSNLIFMIKKNMTKKYKLDIKYLKELMINYLDGVSYDNQFRMYKNTDEQKIFGIEVLYKLVVEFRNNSDFRKDYRSLAALCEHCNIMLMRIEYLMQNNYIDNNEEFLKKFENLNNLANKLLNLQIYYNQGKGKEKTVITIIQGIERIIEEQKLLFGDLLIQLQKY